jgi:hypothetical protein
VHMCLFAYCVTVTQTVQQIVGDMNVFLCILFSVRDKSHPLYVSACGQYMGSIASLPHCYAHCMCVCMSACVRAEGYDDCRSADDL